MNQHPDIFIKRRLHLLCVLQNFLFCRAVRGIFCFPVLRIFRPAVLLMRFSPAKLYRNAALINSKRKNHPENHNSNFSKLSYPILPNTDTSQFFFTYQIKQSSLLTAPHSPIQRHTSSAWNCAIRAVPISFDYTRYSINRNTVLDYLVQT